MRRKERVCIKRFLPVVAALACTLIGLLPAYVLEVWDPAKKQVFHQELTGVGDRFTIRWVHSVTKFPVDETYCIEGPGSIVLVEMRFNQPGPNLPSYPEPPTRWTFTGSEWVVTGYDIKFDAVPVRIGMDVADHKLLHGGHQTKLAEVHEPGGFVEVRVSRMALGGFVLRGIDLWMESLKLE